jgi:hypothetical protein
MKLKEALLGLALLLPTLSASAHSSWWSRLHRHHKSEEPAATAASQPPAPPVNLNGDTMPLPSPLLQGEDALALSEEELDRLRLEQKELKARAAALQAQLDTGRKLLKLKEKQIQELQAQLRATQQ